MIRIRKNFSRNIVIILSLSLLYNSILLSQPNSQTNDLTDKSDIVFDSLVTLFNKTTSDTSKINILNEISWNYAPTNFEKSKRFADSAFVLSDKINWQKGKAYSLKNLGEALRYKGELNYALEEHKVALEIFRKLDDKNGIASVLSNIGIEYYMLSEFPKAFENYSEALEIHESLNNSDGILKNLSLIGTLFFKFERYDEALEYYEKALFIANENEMENYIADQLVNIAVTKIELKKYFDAIEKLETAEKIYKKTKDSYNYSIVLGNLGIAYSRINKYSKALEAFDQTLAFSKKLGDNFGVAHQLGNIGLLKLDIFNYYKEKNSSPNLQILFEAKQFLIESISKFSELRLVEEESFYTLKLASVFKNLGDYKNALDKTERYLHLRDSIYTVENKKMIADLEVRQNLLIKEKEIELLNKDNKYQNLVTRIFIGFSILLIAITLFIFYLYKQKKKHGRILENNIKTIQETELALRKNELELKKHKEQLEFIVKKRTKELENEILERKHTEEDLLVAIERVEAANKTKSVFLENMSHELRTPLVGILGYSELLSSEVESKELKEMAEGINRTGTRLLNTLSMILDLARIESDEFEINITEVNIHEELEGIYNSFKGAVVLKNIDFSLNLSENAKFIYTDKGMFRVIVENLVNNAIKFTKEGSISIKSDINNGFLNISVSDTGIGIKNNEIPIIFQEFKQLSEGTVKAFQGTGLGLSISKRFTEHLSGKLLVESEFGVGSKFTVQLPLN